MESLDAIHEFALVNALCGGLKRSPKQYNQRHEADAEILSLPSGDYLALTIDGLQEEYVEGVLQDPEILGWANVVHSLSDLAAVAAQPMGMLLSYSLPFTADSEWQKRLTLGAHKALEAHGTYCLGGDTSFAEVPSFQSVGVGIIAGSEPLTRKGASPGDLVFLTGPSGLGNYVGLAKAMDEALWKQAEQSYRPRAPLAFMHEARPLLKAAVDTSDGLFAGLDLLSRVNQLGMHIESRPEIFHPAMVALSQKQGTPLWIAGAFGMGDYEVALVVDPAQESAFLEMCQKHSISPLRVAEFLPDEGVTLDLDGRTVPLDTTRLLNLFSESEGVEAYVRSLYAFDAELRA